MEYFIALACITISGAMKSTSAESLDIILGLIPIDLYVRSLAAKSAIRLRSIDCFRSSVYGHGSILNTMGIRPSSFPTDYILTTYQFENPFLTRFPSRHEWRNGYVMGDNDLEVYTDGSKMDSGTGSGVFESSLGIAESYRLDEDNSVFQTEILAISKAAEILVNKGIKQRTVNIFVDSQAAIKALAAREIKSKVVLDCLANLSRLGDQNRTTLCWVPGHEGHDGNEKADELARKGSECTDHIIEASVRKPISSLYRTVDRLTKEIACERWARSEKSKFTKMFFNTYDTNKTKFLLRESKSNLSKIVSIISGTIFLANMPNVWVS